MKNLKQLAVAIVLFVATLPGCKNSGVASAHANKNVTAYRGKAKKNVLPRVNNSRIYTHAKKVQAALNSLNQRSASGAVQHTKAIAPVNPWPSIPAQATTNPAFIPRVPVSETTETGMEPATVEVGVVR